MEIEAKENTDDDDYDDFENHDERVRRLQQQLNELTKRAQRVRAGGPEFRQISEMLDEVVCRLRAALREYTRHSPTLLVAKEPPIQLH